jgi:LEA14-like dessication related protein
MSNCCVMPELNEPIVTLERVKIHAIHATSLDLEVKIKVQNLNSISATLREMPFTIFFKTGEHRKEIASGNTGRLEIAANSSTDVTIPVTSYDLMLVEALATILESGGIHLEIEGNAVIDHVLAGWTLPFMERINLTEKQVIDALEGKDEGIPQ